MTDRTPDDPPIRHDPEQIADGLARDLCVLRADDADDADDLANARHDVHLVLKTLDHNGYLLSRYEMADDATFGRMPYYSTIPDLLEKLTELTDPNETDDPV